jgi:hypothetical protein
MVPTCPFLGRLVPSSTATEVPIRASCESKSNNLLYSPHVGASPIQGRKERRRWPQSSLPFPVRFYSTTLHLFMYCGALCVQQHHPSSVYEYRFGNGLDPLRKEVPPSIDQTLGGSASYLKHQKHLERTTSYAECSHSRYRNPTAIQRPRAKAQPH